MSIRIHELAKKIGMDNKQLLSLLKERKYDVKSVSSTIDNISAEALEQEFAGKVEAAPAAPAPEKTAAPAPASAPAVTESVQVAAGVAPTAFTTRLPLPRRRLARLLPSLPRFPRRCRLRVPLR